jgi:hypothetical protein
MDPHMVGSKDIAWTSVRISRIMPRRDRKASDLRAGFVILPI